MIAGLQFALVLVLFASLRLWQGRDQAAGSKDGGSPVVSNREALGVPLVKLALVSFACFSITEATTGLWAAATWLGYTVWHRSGSPLDRLILWGHYRGAPAVWIPIYETEERSPDPRRAAGLRGRGSSAHAAGPCSTFCLRDCSDRFGDSPIFPAMLHRNAQSLWSSRLWLIMGLQMVVAYAGGTLGSPLFGFLASVTSLNLLPYYVLAAVVTMLAASELLNGRLR